MLYAVARAGELGFLQRRQPRVGSGGQEEADGRVFVLAFCMSKISVSVGHCRVTTRC